MYFNSFSMKYDIERRLTVSDNLLVSRIINFSKSLYKQVIILFKSFRLISTHQYHLHNNIANSSSGALQTLLVKIIKRRELRIELCGTPHERKHVSELNPA